jgi:hypothetical protein
MRTLLRLAIVLTAISAVAAAQDQPGASGTFTVKGKAAKMAYAYAMSRPNPMDTKKAAIRLLLSDVAIPAKTLQSEQPFDLQDLARAGTLHAIEALIDVADKNVLATMMYDAGFKMSSVSVAGTNIKLDLKTLDATTIAGRLYTEKPDDFNDIPFQYDVTFRATIAHGGPGL